MNIDWIKGLNAISVSKMSPEKTGLEFSIHLSPDELLNAVKVVNEKGFFIEDVSGVDTSEGFMVVYHFDHFTAQGRIAFRVLIPHDKPEVPTISGIFSGADWHERECHDFYGVTFTDHPNMTPLLLPDDADFHPLIKEAKNRKPISQLIDPGEVMVRSPEFDAIYAQAQAEDAAIKEGGAEEAKSKE